MGQHLHGGVGPPIFCTALVPGGDPCGLDTAILEMEHVEICRSDRRAVSCLHLLGLSVTEFRHVLYGSEAMGSN